MNPTTISALPQPRATRESAVRTEQEARRARDIVRLLDRRAELRGVHAMADFLDDAVRWTA